MAKNDKLINSLAQIAARNRAEHVRMASEKDTPQIYAAIAMALWELLGMPDEEKADAIEDIFAESQKIWEESIEKNIDMVEWCEEHTGINVMGK